MYIANTNATKGFKMICYLFQLSNEVSFFRDWFSELDGRSQQPQNKLQPPEHLYLLAKINGSENYANDGCQ